MTSYGCQECWLKDIDNFWLKYDTWTWLLSPASQGRYLLQCQHVPGRHGDGDDDTHGGERRQSVGPPTNKKPHLQ